MLVGMGIFTQVSNAQNVTETDKIIGDAQKFYISEQFDSALVKLDELTDYAVAHDSLDYFCLSICLRFLIYDVQGNFSSRVEYIDTLENILAQDTTISIPIRFRSNIALADYYDEIYEYEKSLGYYEELLGIVDTSSIVTVDDLSILYANLADIYLDYGKYREAQLLTERTVALDLKKHGRWSNDLAVDYFNLGMCYLPQDEIRSLNYFWEAKKQFKHAENPDQKEFVKLYLALADNYLKLNLPEQAQLEVDTALAKIQSIEVDYTNLRVKALVQAGVIERTTKKYDQSLVSFDKAIRSLDTLDLRNGYEIKQIFYQIAQSYQVKKDYESALVIIDDILEDIAQSMVGNKTMIEKVRLPSFLFDLYFTKASLHHQRGIENNIIEDWEQAQLHYRFAMDVFDVLKHEVGEHVSKTVLFKKHADFFEEAIDFNFDFWSRFSDEKALEEIYFYVEKSKSNVRNTNFNKVKVEENDEALQTMLGQLRAYSKAITDIEKAIYQTVQQGTPAQAILQTKLLTIKREQKSVLETIHRRFPKYYDMEFKIEIPDRKIIQEQLTDDESILSYFLSEHYLYGIVLTPSNFAVHRVPLIANLERAVKDFRKAIIIGNGNLSREPAIVFATKANDLYEQIFAPFQGLLSERVTIIPDGTLGEIAFDALLTDLPKNENPRTYPYLLKQYAISYEYSMEAYQNRKDDIIGDVSLLGIAPAFNDSLTKDDHLLPPLIYNQYEVKNICKVVGGDCVVAEESTKELFLNTSPNYDILHLATHGIVNRDYPDYTYLAFDNKCNQNYQLYLREIYGLSLDAEMVVLSACETGVGKDVAGEGVMSLARGFSYAGARSIVPSLWSISDGTTAMIMKAFYENLRARKTKDIAMRDAKLFYLENAPNVVVHPFYWAPFVVIGDTDTLFAGHTYSLGVILFVVIVLGGGYFFRISKHG